MFYLIVFSAILVCLPLILDVSYAIQHTKILNSNEYKRQQLIKHHLFTADVDIKNWLKVLNKQF